MKYFEARILAVDARRSRFGYAVFEGPARLLNWGASAIPPQLSRGAAMEAAQKRIASMLRLSCPVVIVVKRPRRTKKRSGVKPRPVLQAILRVASTFQIPVRFLHRRDVQEAFHSLDKQTKDEIAVALVNIFPELLSRLPPQRKAWQTEHYSMIIFDAIAIGCAYWQRNNTKDSEPEGA